ncbi:MAG: hypothetical protein ACKVUS_19450 [Saprospiraceae bacterium]
MLLMDISGTPMVRVAPKRPDLAIARWQNQYVFTILLSLLAQNFSLSSSAYS